MRATMPDMPAPSTDACPSPHAENPAATLALEGTVRAGPGVG